MTPDPRVPLSDAPKVLERLREIQEQAAKATPGPWEWAWLQADLAADETYAVAAHAGVVAKTNRNKRGWTDAAYIAAANPKAITDISRDAVSLIESLLEERTKLREERDGYRKRMGEQRRHIASLERKAGVVQTEDAREPKPDEIAERQVVYRERIEAARRSGDVEWLVDELLRHDEQQQVLILKNKKLREDLSGVRRLRAERDGAIRETAVLRRSIPVRDPLEDVPMYTIRVYEPEAGTYWARVEELPGCFAAGDTLPELFQGLDEAFGLLTSTEEPTERTDSEEVAK